MSEIVMSILTVVIGFGILVLTRFVVHKIFGEVYTSSNEIEKNDNVAVAIRNAGIYLGTGVTMIGTIGDPLKQLIEGLVALVFLVGAIYISDKIVFSKVNNSEEIKNGNISLALGEFGLFFGTGLIAYSSFIGSGPFISSLVFFVLGQVVLVLTALIAERVYSNIKTKITEDKNIGAGILLGSTFISLAFILKGAIIGDFVSWSADILSFIEYSLIGFVLLFIFANKAIDKIFLPTTEVNENLDNKNISSIIILSAVKIAIAILISTAI